MRKTKLPTQYKGGEKCKNCGALLVHRYDSLNDVYFWTCQGCNMFRCEPSARFETRFIAGDKIQ